MLNVITPRPIVLIGTAAAVTAILVVTVATCTAHDQRQQAKVPIAAAEVAAKTAEAQTGAAKASAEIEQQGQQIIRKIKARTQKHVRKIEAAAAADPAYDPDADFYIGVCDTGVYYGHPVCRDLGLVPARAGSAEREDPVPGGRGGAEAPAAG